MDTIPEVVFSFSGLQTLDLTENRIKTLGPGQGNLTALRTLHLDLNPLGQLPAEIGALTSLRELRLGHNRLRDWMPDTEVLL